MQSAITTQIEKVQTSLNFLSGRVDRLEGNLSDTAERLEQCYASVSSSSSAESEESGRQRRKRVAPDKSVRAHYFLTFNQYALYNIRVSSEQFIIILQWTSNLKLPNRT